MEIVITEAESGKSLRDYLKKDLGMSRAELSHLKSLETGIMINGVRVTVRAVLAAGDVLFLDRDDAEAGENVVPSDIPLDIIYEDGEIIALNKPAGMPTHPSHGHYDDTLANGLAFYFAKKNIPFIFRAVNRLDRDTSGIVLVAKNRASAYRISSEMSRGGIKKTYIAVAEGAVYQSGTVIANIKRRYESIIERTVCPENEGQYAETRYTPLYTDGNVTLLEMHPVTGRTHQIRVHMAYIGHPLCGDTLYGKESELIGRQALHCSRLEFTHPATGERITLTAPVKGDMERLCRRIGADVTGIIRITRKDIT